MSVPAWDDDWLDECMTRGEVISGRVSASDFTCRWCSHPEHGVECSSSSCKCDSSFTSRDDSWRPSGTPWNLAIYTLMHTHGVDGFIATRTSSQKYATKVNQIRLMRWIATPYKPEGQPSW